MGQLAPETQSIQTDMGSLVIALFCATTILLQGLMVYANVHSHVDINLDDGVVNGYSERIHFISTPSADENTVRCGRQAVIKVHLGGRVKVANFHLKYNAPRLWTFHISDTMDAEGYGYYTTDGNSSVIEMQVLNQQMRMYAAWPSPSVGPVSDGSEPGSVHSQWMYLRVIDETIQRSNIVELSLSMKLNTVRWHDDRLAHDFSAPPGLFYENGEMKDNVTLYIAMNRIIAGNWREGSGLCHLGIKLMEHEEECNAVDMGCDPYAICKPNRKGFHCSCRRGWQGNGTVCQDINECLPKNAGCVHKCHNVLGSYKCSCHPGFTTDPNDSHNCIDINECSINNGGCEQECINTIGSFECKCTRNGVSHTTNQKYCRNGNLICFGFGCQSNCEVTHNKQLRSCSCLPGYQLNVTNGKSCQRSCYAGNGGCHHHCHNTSSGPICSCQHKYLLGLDNHSCAASCYVNNGGCHKRCTNTNVGVMCSCPSGYLLNNDGKTCDDINECAAREDGCQHKCVNTIGGYECLCPPGFKLNPIDERTCIDIDECEVNDTCEHTCINTAGSYLCQCKVGYQLFGKTHCGDIDECTDSKGGCPQVCINTEGSYYCSSHPVDHKLNLSEKECIAAYSANMRFLVSGVSESQKKSYGQRMTKKLQEQILDCSLQFNKMQVMAPRKVATNFGHIEGNIYQVHMEITCNNKTTTCDRECHSTNPKEAICKTASLLKEKSSREFLIVIENKPLYILPKSLVFRHFHSKSCGGKGERKRVQDLCSNSHQLKEENFQKVPKHAQLDTDVQNVLGQKLSSIEFCPSGAFWNVSSSSCQLCPNDTYQDNARQKSCKKCPENSFTDGVGSVKLDDCKRTKCQSYMNELSGFIESPNFPGDYPSNADCLWILKPPKRRRLLIILSELHLAGSRCQDVLMMRKSKSPVSPVTFEACRSISKPVAFVAQSKTLWIHFRSDSYNNSKGFHISFVTYNEEYQSLIEDIVQDSRLYASQNHLEILRDKKLLSALMEVIAQPINYYKYESEKRKMFPSSFIRFMTPKVRKFFSYR